MNTILKYILIVPLLTMIMTTNQAAELDRLSGKWATEKKNDQGVKTKQILEFKGSQFKFWIKSLDGATFIYAEGKVKAEKAGDLRILKFIDIKGGESESSIEPIYDDRTGYKSLTIAMNFESFRDEEPVLDVYKKTE